MTTTNEAPLKTPTTLKFNRQTYSLVDSIGTSVSLGGGTPNQVDEFWRTLPWGPESAFDEIDLDDLPCRLEARSLSLCLQQLWHLGREGAVVKIRVPHPRHDIFIEDLGYIKALLPETFAQLDPRTSSTGLAAQLGVNFEFLDATAILDSHWQDAVDRKEITYDDIALISLQACNVIKWNTIELKINKSLWVQANAAARLTPEMRQQLQEQLNAQMARGDHHAADVIRQFLENGAQNESR